MKRFFKGAIFVLLFIMIAVAGRLAYERWTKEDPFPEGLIQVNGRMEGNHMTVAAKFPGRVQQLLAKEGDLVKQDRVLVRLDDAQTRAQGLSGKTCIWPFWMHGSGRLRWRWRSSKKEVPLVIEASDAALLDAAATVLKAKAAEQQAAHDNNWTPNILLNGINWKR